MLGPNGIARTRHSPPEGWRAAGVLQPSLPDLLSADRMAMGGMAEAQSGSATAPLLTRALLSRARPQPYPR